jgi:hypothetical protein
MYLLLSGSSFWFAQLVQCHNEFFGIDVYNGLKVLVFYDFDLIRMSNILINIIMFLIPKWIVKKKPKLCLTERKKI